MTNKLTRLNTFGIYFVPRRLVEDEVPNRLKRLKKLRNKKANSSEDTKDIDDEIKKLSGNRPCVILKQYNANITVIPFTHSDEEVDLTNIESKVFKNHKKKSFIKTSVIVTISRNKFMEVCDRYGNVKLPQNEIDTLLKQLGKHYLGKKTQQ